MQNIFNKNLLFLSIAIFSGLVAFCQNPEIFFSELKSEYPNENVVVFDRKLHYVFEINNNKVEVFLIEKSKTIFLKNPSGMTPSQSLYTSTMKELVDFEANAYITDGKKYKVVPVKEYKEKMNVDQYSFYDDLKELSFTFPGVAKGTIIELNSKHKINEPRLISPVYLTSYAPIRNFEITIESDPDINYELIFLNHADELCNFSNTQTRSKKISRCELLNLEKLISEDEEPEIAYFAPHFIPKIKSYTVKGKETEVLKDLKSLYNWYYTLTEDLVKSPVDAPIQLIADSLTKNCTSELEEVQALYYWIQSNIKYVAFEYGLGGFVPRKPGETFKNRYGDCKDKTVLLFTLLKARGITSHLTWIGTYGIPYSYEQVPTPNADNHMIITYIAGDTYYFLDGTNNFHNFYLPSQFIQGKEAFISIDEKEFRIKKVPVQSSAVSQFIDSVQLEIKEKSIEGSGIFTFTGYNKTNLYHALKNKTEEVKKQILERKIQKGNNKFVLEDYDISDYENFDTDVTVNYDFNLNDYIQNIDNTLYLNLNLDKGWLEFKTKTDRKHPVFLNYATTNSNQYYLKIPDNYSVGFLPEAVSLKSEHFNIQIKYSVTDNIVHYDHFVTADIIFIDQNTLPEWNEFIKTLEKVYKQTIILKKDE